MITPKRAIILKQGEIFYPHFVKLTEKKRKKYSGQNKTNNYFKQSARIVGWEGNDYERLEIN